MPAIHAGVLHQITRPTARRVAVALIAVTAALLAAGCAPRSGPSMLVVDAPSYDVAFNAAVEAARRKGMPAVLMDRRLGVIETGAEVAGSLVEPWRTDNASPAQAIEHTFALQRRRCRFEFTPTGFRADAMRPGNPDDLTGPDVFAESIPPDLTGYAGPVELRVRVFVERAYTPGTRVSTWSHRMTTRTVELPGDPADPYRDGAARGPLPGRFWTPIGRDRAYERRLIADVQTMLGAIDEPADG